MTWIESVAGESGNGSEIGGVVFLSGSLSPFPVTWVSPLSFGSSLVSAPSLQVQDRLSPLPPLARC